MGCYRAGGEHDSGKIIGPTIDGDAGASNCPASFRTSAFPLKRPPDGRNIHSTDGVVYPGLSAYAPQARQIPYHGHAGRRLTRSSSPSPPDSEDDLMANRLARHAVGLHGRRHQAARQTANRRSRQGEAGRLPGRLRDRSASGDAASCKGVEAKIRAARPDRYRQVSVSKRRNRSHRSALRHRYSLADRRADQRGGDSTGRA